MTDVLRNSEVCLGYYGGVTGPKLFSPLHVDNEFPELTELHESLHKSLAESNSTDLLGRILANMLHEGKHVFQKVHSAPIEKLLRTINKQTAFVHESYATYVSMLMYVEVEAERIRSARRRLPEFYRLALVSAENGFGSLEQNPLKIHGANIFPILLGTAIAAMNIDFRELDFKLSSLDAWCDFIDANSPNKRYTSILDTLGTFHRQGLLAETIKVSGDKDASALQQYFFSKLKEALPSIGFVSNHQEGTEWMHEVVADVKTELSSYGYGFVNNFQLRPPSETSRDVNATKLEIPDMNPLSPLDTSLTKLSYQPGSWETLSDSLDESEEANSFFCAHLLPTPEKKGLLSRWKSRDCLMPSFLMPPRTFLFKDLENLSDLFYYSYPFDQILKRLKSQSRGHVILKVDERLARGDIAAIKSTGHILFILSHDNSPKNVIGTIEEYAAEGRVTVFQFGLAIPSYRALVVRCADHSVYYIAPVTSFGATVIEQHLENIAAVEVISEAGQVENKLGNALDFIGGILLTSYCLP